MKLILAILMAFSVNAYAATPSPISNTIGKVTATSGERTATFYLSGDGLAAPMRYKAEVFKWTKEGLEPTKDLIVMPSNQTIMPNNKYVFKVLSKIARKEVEQTYRIKFSFLETQEELKDGQVRLVPNWSIPIFIAPTVPEFTKIEKTRNGNKWVFKNIGNSTYKTGEYNTDGKNVKETIYLFPNTEIEYEGKDVELGAELVK